MSGGRNVTHMSWSPYEALSVDEKIRRTEKAIDLLKRYGGPVANDMLRNKELLLKDLKKVRGCSDDGE